MRARIASAMGEPAFGVAAMISRLPWLQHQASRSGAPPLRPGARQTMIASVAVDLKDAVESFENPLGVLAAASRRVMIDHDRRIGAAMAAVVAQNGPQIAGLRPAAAGIEHRRPRLVHEQAAGQLHQRAHALDERREVEGDRSHPIGQNGAVEHDAVPREDLRLAVERHVLAELRDRHLRQQRLGRDAALDQMRGRRRLGDARAALRTGVAGPHGLDDAILRRRHVEAAGAVLADPNHLAAAAGTCEALWLDHALDARQMCGKGARGAAGSFARRRAPRAARAIVLALLDFGDRDLDVFQNELQLIGIELLRALAEARAFVFLDEQLETFDRLLRCSQLALDVKARGELVRSRRGCVRLRASRAALRTMRADRREALRVGRNRSSASCRRNLLASKAPNEAESVDPISSPQPASPRSAHRRASSSARRTALRTEPGVNCRTPSLICGQAKPPSPRRL